MYIPKNRIITNLYTYGEEYQDFNSQEYIGHYHKLYNGRVFSGKTPNDSPIFELFEYSPPLTSTFLPTSQRPGFAAADGPPYPPGFGDEEINIVSNQSYILAKEQRIVDQVYNLPYNVHTKPTQEDYNLGVFTRYFCVKTNELVYMEVDKKIYDKIKNQDKNWAFELYTPFSIPWTLTGEELEVEKTNRNIVLLQEQRLKRKGLQQYLKHNYLKFYQPSLV